MLRRICLYVARKVINMQKQKPIPETYSSNIKQKCETCSKYQLTQNFGGTCIFISLKRKPILLYNLKDQVHTTEEYMLHYRKPQNNYPRIKIGQFTPK